MTDVVTIKIRKNGPYLIQGPIRLIDAEGNEFPVPADGNIVLCRCGQSAHKPFCDASHRSCGFEADTIAPTSESPAERS